MLGSQSRTLEGKLMVYWYQGSIVNTDRIELDRSEPGLLYGATIFTTLRVYPQRSIDHPATAYHRHQTRLMESVGEFGWPAPDWQAVKQGTIAIAKIKPVVRITLFPDGSELIMGRDLPPELANWYARGVKVTIAPPIFDRSLAAHKTGNYLAPWLSRQSALKRGAQDAILTNPAGEWLEVSTGNLWGYRGGTWYTPPLAAGILPGIARAQMIEYLESIASPVVEVNWTQELVSSLEEVGYSNCTIGIVAIAEVIADSQIIKFDRLAISRWQQLQKIWEQ
jgi:4-amino-4-deoxychorismate lyase